MDAVAALTRLGGVGATHDVLALCSRRRLRTALERGDVVRLSRNRYGLPDGAHQLRVAASLSGTLSHLSAAHHHGWAVKFLPEQTWVTVPRNRKVPRELQARHAVRFADLAALDVDGGRTAPMRTVLDCGRALPFDEALTVADSAVRAGAVDLGELRAAAAALRGPGAGRSRRVAALADARAANPFESVLRALVIESGVLDLEPQPPVSTRTMTFHPDLVDRRRRVVIEADSWTFHRDHDVHARDCTRHTALAVAGWRVLRFTWEQVMHSPAYVSAVLADL